MATAKDLDFTYSLIDRIFRLSLGEMADFSGAKFDGDFSLTLEQAQRRKHEYIGEQIGISEGRRVLDLGCGWGPLLNFIRERKAAGVGVTLSSGQYESCRRQGLDVHMQNALEFDRDTFGPFDAIASLGAFEHFCSFEDHAAGRQDQIYGDLFANVATTLPAGGRFYLQTMVFGPNAGDPARATLDADPDSDEYMLALMKHQFPGSFLPFGYEQIEKTAAPHFRLVEKSSGRLDYIETISRWRARFAEPSFRKTMLKARLVPKYLTSKEFRLAFTSGVSSNTECFERELLEHYRLVFEKPA